MHLFSCPSHAYIYDIHTFRQSVTITIVEAVRGSLWLSMLTSHMPGIPTLATMTANLPGHYDPASWKGWTRWLWICNDMYGWLWTYVKGSLKATDNIFLSNCHIVLWIFGKVREFIPRFGVVDRCPTPFFELIVMLMGNRPVFGCNLAFMDCVHIVYHFAKWWRKVLTFWLKKHGVEESGGSHSFVGSDNFPDNLVFLVVASPNTTPPRKIKEVSYQPYHTVSSASTWTHLDATKSHKDASGFKIDRLQTQSQPQYIG